MNALTKVSIALLFVTATTIAAYLYIAPGTEGFDAARSQDAICKQDGERLARLRARPSLDEGLRFVGEIRCVQLWPQLQTLMDSLSDPSRSIASSKADRAASDATPASDSASSPGATSDDDCRRDEDRLAELRANPSAGAAIRFDNELKCPRLRPQLQEILTQLSHDGGSAEAANRRAPAPDTKSASAAEQASEPAATEATAAASEDACKQDEERLAELQANPSVDAAIRFDNELKCPRLKPQLPEILTLLSHARGSVEAAERRAPTPDTKSAGAAEQASEPAASDAAAAESEGACKQEEERLAALQAKPSLDEAVRLENEFKCLKLQPQLLVLLDKLIQAPQSAETQSSNGAPSNPTSSSEAAPPTSGPPASEATSQASDDACKQDEERMARLRASPSREEAARFSQELNCETLRPELRALVAALASPPDPASISRDAGAPMKATNETLPAADAERRIAQLESEKEALAEEVNRLQQASSAEQASPPPTSPPPSVPAGRPDSERAPEAAADAERRIAQLESENEALTAEVSRLRHERETPSADQAKSPPAPPPAAYAKRSAPDPLTASASLPAGMPARVLIRYLPNNADARAQAEMLANVLKRQGIEVADLRESRSAIRPELSFFYAPDEPIAQQVGRLVGIAPVRRPQSRDGLMVRPGAVELNLSGESHLAGNQNDFNRGE